jgi:hypothetical protein
MPTPSDAAGRPGARGLEARLRSLGARDPVCSVPGCGERDPWRLTGVAPDVLCAEHRAAAQGRDTIEDHHVAGRHNHPATVGLPANSHAALTHRQQSEWPRELLRNPDADPLVAMGARLRGSKDVIEEIVSGVLPTSDELDELGEFLDRRDGTGWRQEYRDYRRARRDDR